MNRLEELREARGLNMKEAAAEMGLPYTTYRNYEKGERQLDSELLIFFADFYDVSIDYLLCRDEKVVQIKPQIVQKYEKLDDISKSVVDSVINIELERVAEDMVEIRVLPAAAGPDEPVDGLAEQFTQVPANSKAQFAVRISGDSMESEFHHGDIVLCTHALPKDGEIAAVMVNGSLLVKQYIGGIGGSFYLRSLNRERKELDYDFLSGSQDNIYFIGTVIHRRLRLVQEWPV